MNYQDKMKELSDYIENFKKEFAEIEDLNPNYLSIIIDDSNYITIIPTNDTGIVDCYRG